MQINITENKDNPLLERVELKGTLAFEGSTPSNQDLSQALATQTKNKLPLIVIRRILTSFGKKEASFEAVAYKNEAAMSKTEKMTKHLRKKAQEDKKKAQEAAKKAAEEKEAEAAKAQEAPVEEKKEEAPKTEEKPAEEKKEGEQ